MTTDYRHCTFVDNNRAFPGLMHLYHKRTSAKISLTLDFPGSPRSEVNLEFVHIGRAKQAFFKLSTFGDAMLALSNCDLLERLGHLDGTQPTPNDVMRLLLSMGFKDLTDHYAVDSPPVTES